MCVIHSHSLRPFPYGKTSELIVTNLWVGPRPLTHNTAGQRGHNPSTYIPYLLTTHCTCVCVVCMCLPSKRSRTPVGIKRENCKRKRNAFHDELFYSPVSTWLRDPLTFLLKPPPGTINTLLSPSLHGGLPRYLITFVSEIKKKSLNLPN